MAYEPTTLSDFSQSAVDTDPEPTSEQFSFPHMHPEAPPEIYDQLDSEMRDFQQLLTTHLPSPGSGRTAVVDYDAASYTDYSNLIDANPAVGIRGLAAACHMSERMIREHGDVSGVFGYASSGTIVEESIPVQRFIRNCCLEHLTGTVPVETPVYLFYRLYEYNRIRRNGEPFYRDIHKSLSDVGYHCETGYDLPGSPNLLITESEDSTVPSDAVVGFATAGKDNDVITRARKMGTYCEQFKREHPAVPWVVIYSVNNMELTGTQRTRKRERIHHTTESIDAVFFGDEQEKLQEFCHQRINNERGLSGLPSQAGR